MQRNDIFPFTAFVGEERTKRAMMVNLIDNAIGGILLIGPEGCGKKTLSRSLLEIIPNVDAVRDCPFCCDPIHVEALCTWCKQMGSRRRVSTQVPHFIEYRTDLSGEDISGYINFGNVKKKIISHTTNDYIIDQLGVKIDEELSYIPGMASLANRGVFFIPDVERVDDDLADILIRYKSLRQGSVEDEGVRFEFPTGFLLLATTSAPDEVSSRIKSALTLHINMRNSDDLEMHTEIMDRVRQFEGTPEKFRKIYEGELNGLKQKINRAARFAPRVTTPENIWAAIERIGDTFNLGERETLAIERISRALCAYERRQRVSTDDVALALELMVPEDTLEKYFI
jgi:Mg-chelatase subunit ChlI